MSAAILNRPSTLVEELQRDGQTAATLTHLEAPELARYIAETYDGDPNNDPASYLTDSLNDVDLREVRPTLNALTVKLLLGTITVEDQQRFNELMRAAMLDSGLHKVRFALEQAERSHFSAKADRYERQTGRDYATGIPKTGPL